MSNTNTASLRGRGRPAKYPFASLNVGQDFSLPNPPVSLRACAYLYAKRHNMTFETHGVKGTPAIRVVRTA
jgi:hypothetical protein